MAYQIEGIRRQYSNTNGTTTKIEADISVSKVADLPEVDDTDGYELLDCSICLVRQTGAWYILDGGAWYAADGSGQPADDSVQSLSMSPNLGNSIRPAVNLDTLPVSEPEEVIEPAEDGEER